MKLYLFLLGFMLLVSVASPANILAVLTLASPSHHIWNSALMVALAERGHNITILTVDPMKTPVPNITDIPVTGVYEAINEEFEYEGMMEIPLFQMVSIGFQWMEIMCSKVLKSDGFRQLMDYPSDTKFDLVIAEAWTTECTLPAVASKFNYPPLIFVHAFTVTQFTLQYTGSPVLPSFMPNFFLPSPGECNFWERLMNFVAHVLVNILFDYSYLPKMEETARQHVGPHVPPAKEVFERVSLALGNYHPAFEAAYPLSPNNIPVAGLQIKEPKPLPKDLQEFLDEAKHGVILFSLGTNIQSSNLPAEKLRAILDAFREIPQRVLWKFELDTLDNLPENVKVGKWLPQSDILAHPSIKLFISHCGLLSSHETVYRGVPVVGIPFIGDQFTNCLTLRKHGVAEQLLFPDLTKESLLEAINKVLHNPSYRENMKELSERFRDTPMKPLDTAVFWTEYVIKHKGAPHLRPPSVKLNTVQYFLLDVIAFLVAVAAFAIYLPIFLCKRLCGRRDKKMKQS